MPENGPETATCSLRRATPWMLESRRRGGMADRPNSPAIRPPAIARSAMRSSTTSRCSLHLNAGRTRPSSWRHICRRLPRRRPSPSARGGRGDGPRAAGAGTGRRASGCAKRVMQPNAARGNDCLAPPRQRACRLRAGIPAKGPRGDAPGPASRAARIPIRASAVAATDGGRRNGRPAGATDGCGASTRSIGGANEHW
jgi:hypothetical protein